jgi:hypothetical protein
MGREAIESLGHENRFGKMVEIRIVLHILLKLISCNSFVSLFVRNSLVMD